MPGPNEGYHLLSGSGSDMTLNCRKLGWTCLFSGNFLSFGEPQEFEIELEGSQTLRILCYEKCYNKMKMTKEDGESADKLMGKGQVQVSLPHPTPSHLDAPWPLPHEADETA
jgi:hypothetical protein